jgi:hypothetical protein
MTLVLSHASFATVDELFRFKLEGFELPPFPGYTPDQWGIKAHNRPWIAASGRWRAGQRVIEVGGAYSRLPEWLGSTYDLEPWIGDDFGASTGTSEMWSRWGDPQKLPEMFPSVTYRFENFGPGSGYEDGSFDRIFSVSTLEHVPVGQRVDVIRDIHRTLAPGGVELHSIDISIPSWHKVLFAAVLERGPARGALAPRYPDGLASWWEVLKASGVDVSRVRMPSSLHLLERSILVESPDVVYRFFEPMNAPSSYDPGASLLLIIEDR